jgi:pyruvate formate lyase activating enzyme
MVDPVEKEPAHHMLPGSDILCMAAAGCNSRCKHCQNWEISQADIEKLPDLGHSPKALVTLAEARKCPTVSFTYSDPIAFYEYMYDTCVEAKKRGLLTLCHTNGTLREEPLQKLLEVLDAVTVDLKGFTERFYRETCSMKLAPVLSTLKAIRKAGRHLEIVNLMIPTLNDGGADVKRMCRWIADQLGHDVPLHLNRFHPAYRLRNLPPTPVRTLEASHAVAKGEGLEYVYIGNVPGHRYNSTFCPKCGAMLIQRFHFFTRLAKLKDGACRECGHSIPGIWTV